MIEPERIRIDISRGSNDYIQDQIFEFLKIFIDNNPDCFSATQTLILLTRICVVSLLAMNNKIDISYEVL